jgi:hypothetical protein
VTDPGGNPTIVSYNVKITKILSGPVRFVRNKNIFSSCL